MNFVNSLFEDLLVELGKSASLDYFICGGSFASHEHQGYLRHQYKAYSMTQAEETGPSLIANAVDLHLSSCWL